VPTSAFTATIVNLRPRESGPENVFDHHASSELIESANAAVETGFGQPGPLFRKNCTGLQPRSASFVPVSQTRYSTATTSFGSLGAPAMLETRERSTESVRARARRVARFRRRLHPLHPASSEEADCKMCLPLRLNA